MSVNNVVVNLNVGTSVAGTINLVETTVPLLNNVLTCTATLPASTLNDLIWFQDISDVITGYRSSAPEASDSWDVTGFNTSMQSVIEGAILPKDGDSYAYPYNADKYSSLRATTGYSSLPNLGKFVLSVHAHNLFQHVQALVPMASESVFLDYVHGTGTGKADIASSYGTALRDLTNENCSAIAQQVIGQDASRATNADNTEAAPDARQPLLFIAGDIVYVQLTVNKPDVVTPTNQSSQQYMPTTDDIESITYSLKITLS